MSPAGTLKCFLALFLMVVPLASLRSASPPRELKHFALDSLDGLVTRSGVELDKENSSDGHGSLRINSSGSTTIRLFEFEKPGVENTQLIYQARIRTRELKGKAYLEMWCRFPGKGEFFSRALNQTYSGSTEWSTTETPFLLRAGEKPDLVRLNLVVDGTGIVWIDDIRLLKAPLK